MTDTFTRFVLGVLLAVMICWILIVGQVIILPFVAGIIAAYVIHGLAQRIARLPGIDALPPGLPNLLSVLVISAVIVGGSWLILRNLGQVLTLDPQEQARLTALLQIVAKRLGIESEPSWIALRSDLMSYLGPRRVIGMSAGPILSLAATFVVILVYSGFLVLERDSFARKIAMMSEDPAQVARLQRIIHDINNRIGTYLVMKTMINIGLALLSYAIMRLFGIPFAGFWAVLIGLFNYIPYVGSYLGVGFPALMAGVQFGALWPFALFVLAMSAAQILLGTFIEPWLMGKSLNLSRVVILLSLVVWSSIWGIPGAILSVPIMAMLVIVFSEFRGTRPLAILLSQDGDVGGGPSSP